MVLGFMMLNFLMVQLVERLLVLAYGLKNLLTIIRVLQKDIKLINYLLMVEV